MTTDIVLVVAPDAASVVAVAVAAALFAVVAFRALMTTDVAPVVAPAPAAAFVLIDLVAPGTSIDLSATLATPAVAAKSIQSVVDSITRATIDQCSAPGDVSGFERSTVALTISADASTALVTSPAQAALTVTLNVTVTVPVIVIATDHTVLTPWRLAWMADASVRPTSHPRYRS